MASAGQQWRTVRMSEAVHLPPPRTTALVPHPPLELRGGVGAVIRAACLGERVVGQLTVDDADAHVARLLEGHVVAPPRAVDGEVYLVLPAPPEPGRDAHGFLAGREGMWALDAV